MIVAVAEKMPLVRIGNMVQNSLAGIEFGLGLALMPGLMPFLGFHRTAKTQ